MSGLFNVDSPFIQFLNKVADICILSFMYLVCCIPLFTFGAATTALYYTTVKSIRRERGYVIRSFFKSFKENFLSGTIYTFLILLASYIAYINLAYAKSLEGNLGIVMFFVYFAILYFAIGVFVYIFPVLSRFSMKKIPMIKLCALLSVKHFPSTFAMELIIILAGYFLYTAPALIICLPALLAGSLSYLMEPILKKYTVGNDSDEENKPWYLE